MTKTKEQLANLATQAFILGHQSRNEEIEKHKQLMDDIIHVLSLASMDNFSRRELAFEAKLLLQKIRMRDEAVSNADKGK